MNDHRKKSERKRIMPLIIILVVVSVGFGAYKIWDYIYSHRSIADIPEPVQVDLEGKARSEAHVVYGADFGRPQYKLEMFYLAEYDIKGLVVGTKHMSDETAYDKSFPVDVSLSWGEFAAHRDAVDCTNGPRKLSCTYSTDKLAKYGANRSIMNQVSNNHLSPSSREIYDKIKRIRAGNYVEIKGYLVSVKVSTDRDSFEATSSLSRTDHMDGAFDRTNTGCEMIYVTSVEWLD